MLVFKDAQISLAPLQGKTIAIIGYGNQGKPQAQNLRDSGIQVIIGLRATSTKRNDALAEGFQVASIPQAVLQSQVVMMLLPDETMGQVYQQDIEPYLKPGSYLGFSHGMAIHAQWVQPALQINIFLLAPKAQGRGVRNRYLAGSGVPGLVAVHQNPSQDTLEVALAYGKAIGCSRAGIVQTTFADETTSDLFSEQTVLCGGLTQLIKTAFEVLIENGIAPEVAYFECLYEVKLIADLLQEGGITFMRNKISSTALYGDVSRGEQVIDAHVKENMRRVFFDIQSGKFAAEFLADAQAGYPNARIRVEQDYHHPIEVIGRLLRQERVL